VTWLRRRDGKLDAKWIAGALLVFAAYTATAKLGLTFDALSGVATTVWPPTGIALTALIRLGYGAWPAVAAAALVVNATQPGVSIVAAVIIATGNTLEALAGAAALRRLGFRTQMNRLRDVFALVLAAALGSTAISATFGTVAVAIAGRPPVGYLTFWSTWWIGDMIGNLLVAPLLLTWTADLRLGHNRRRQLESAVMLALLAVAASFSFGGFFVSHVSEILRGTYVVWPLLIWAALRFGPRGATTAVFLLGVLATACTARGLGPFVRDTPHESLRLLQSYLGITAVTVITLAAAMGERMQAIAVRDDFLSIASHELKTPLTALKLTLDRAAQQLEAGEPPPTTWERMSEWLGASRRQMGRIERLIEDLLDVTRLRADRLSLTFERLSLTELVRETATRFGEELARVGCPLELDVPEGINARCDRTRVEQVLTNLVTNAIKYAPGQPVEVSLRADDGYVRVAVRDHGAGIPKREQARIFEPYRRLASTKHMGGLGLGLYIGRQIAEAHRGALWVESAPGAGTRFVLELPLDPHRAARR
jgi:signal transduction histidine kinase